jgi:hypothetical protein
VDLDIYEALIRRSLENGVPHQIVAATFELPVDVVKEMQREVHVTQYGTADQSEYLDHIQWLTLKRAAQMIEHGSPAEAAKVASAVLGRQIAAAGKRPSDQLTKARTELLAAFAQTRGGEAQRGRAGRFVVGNATMDRPSQDEGGDDDED